MKNKKEKKITFLDIDICGEDLENMVIQYLKNIISEKQEIVYLEVIPEKDKLQNKHILNDDYNNFKIFVELKEK